MGSTKEGTVIYLRAEGENERVRRSDAPMLGEVQEAVGGFVAMIDLGDGRKMYVDEDGLLKKRPVNPAATKMVIDAGLDLSHVPIVGDAVVIAGFDSPTGLAEDAFGPQKDEANSDKHMTMGAVSRTKVVRHSGNFYDYQPGNCTRYHLCVTQVIGHERLDDGGFVLSWLHKGDVAGPSMMFTKTQTYDVSYVADKMGIDIADAMPLLVFMRDMFAINIFTDPRFDMDTGCSQPHRDWQ